MNVLVGARGPQSPAPVARTLLLVVALALAQVGVVAGPRTASAADPVRAAAWVTEVVELDGADVLAMRWGELRAVRWAGAIIFREAPDAKDTRTN